jgi:hypothetical protein
VMLVSARMFPWKAVDVPSVAEPTSTLERTGSRSL